MEQLPKKKPILNSRFNVWTISINARLPKLLIPFNPIRPIHDVFPTNNQ